jgi:TIR domain
MSDRTKVFISYSHADEDWLDRLRIHLRPLERDYGIDIWDDRKIRAGSKWREEIEKAVSSAKVAVLLVSASFLASDFIAKDELPPLLNAAEEEGATILPVIIGACRFLRTSSLCRFQAVNDPATPLINLPNYAQEALLEKVSEAIEASLQSSPKTRTLLAEKDELRGAILPTPKDDDSIVEKNSRVDRSRSYNYLWYALIIAIIATLSLLAWLLYVNNAEKRKAASTSHLSEPTLRTYFDYITLQPRLGPIGSTNCHVTHHVALRFEVPEGQQAIYQGRIQSLGRTELDSNPSCDVLNWNQWYGNPTFLKFSIEEKPQPGSILDIEAVAYEDTDVALEQAKIGSHLPYRTEYAVVIIDYSRMKFGTPPNDIRGQLEFRGPDGRDQTENLSPVLHPKVQDSTVTLMRHNLPAESSIILRWGDKQ